MILKVQLTTSARNSIQHASCSMNTHRHLFLESTKCRAAYIDGNEDDGSDTRPYLKARLDLTRPTTSTTKRIYTRGDRGPFVFGARFSLCRSLATPSTRIAFRALVVRLLFWIALRWQFQVKSNIQNLSQTRSMIVPLFQPYLALCFCAIKKVTIFIGSAENSSLFST